MSTKYELTEEVSMPEVEESDYFDLSDSDSDNSILGSLDDMDHDDQYLDIPDTNAENLDDIFNAEDPPASNHNIDPSLIEDIDIARIEDGYSMIAKEEEAGSDVVRDIVGDGTLDGDTVAESTPLNRNNKSIREAVDDYKYADVRESESKRVNPFEYAGTKFNTPTQRSRGGRGRMGR